MDNLILSFTVVFPLFAQLVLGYGLKRIKLLDDHTLSVCNKLVFRVFLPCLLFLNVYRANLAQVFNARLLAWAAAQPGRYILEDDYDSEFRFDTRPLPSLQGMAGPDGPVVYLTTFSKSLAPGIRIACMVLPQSLLVRYRRDFATYANTVSRFEQQTLCEFMAGGYFTRHLARMRLAYKRRMEAFAAALRAALPGAELDGVHSGLHFLLTLPGAGGERAMVEAAARQGVRLRGLSEYYLARPELCRPDTVVAGYSALREEDVQAVAQALARAWLCAPGNG